MYWLIGIWIICGGLSYFVSLKTIQVAYPDWFNREELDEDRKWCLKIALLGPMNLLVASVLFFTQRKRKTARMKQE